MSSVYLPDPLGVLCLSPELNRHLPPTATILDRTVSERIFFFFSWVINPVVKHCFGVTLFKKACDRLYDPVFLCLYFKLLRADIIFLIN
jgi:hypothetical protein